mmetsp:Transcript_7949/g.12607  ORF Transcript_7949/g.12607 Transcript_7949/m.12607 type:complete len:167 (+) Transcript_7949:206-706(+)
MNSIDRIFLDLIYILDVGTLITDLDIECPGMSSSVYFLEPNYVMPVADQGQGSRFFASGTFPGEVSVKDEDILIRILARGDRCEFSSSVRTILQMVYWSGNFKEISSIESSEKNDTWLRRMVKLIHSMIMAKRHTLYYYNGIVEGYGPSLKDEPRKEPIKVCRNKS